MNIAAGPLWHLAFMTGGAYLLTHWLVPRLMHFQIQNGLTAENYSGRKLPAALGLVFPLIYGSALAAAALAGSGPARQAHGVALLLGLALMSFWGLLDDVLGSGGPRGWRGHFSALRSGRLTTGTMKIAGIGTGGAVAMAAAGMAGPVLLPAALIIALSANALNLFDLRPGRAVKVFWLLFFAAAALVPQALFWQAYLPLLAAVLAYTPWDITGRAMMGDTGANGLGGVAGMTLVWAALERSPWIMFLIGFVLLAVNLIGERRSWSSLIAANHVLLYLDRVGLPGSDAGKLSGARE